MNKIQTKIPLFDIDWTLLVGRNSGHVGAFKHMFTTVFDQPTAEISDIVPHGMIDSQIIMEVLKVHGIPEEQSKPKLEQAYKAMDEYYAANKKDSDVQTMPGVELVLEKLKELNVPMGVLSGNIEGMAWAKLQQAGIRDYFTFGAFGNMAYRRSELVEIARQNAIKALGYDIPISQFVIIGDTPLDVSCAKEAGIESVTIAGGSNSAEQLKAAGSDLVLDSFEQVDEFVNFIV